MYRFRSRLSSSMRMPSHSSETVSAGNSPCLRAKMSLQRRVLREAHSPDASEEEVHVVDSVDLLDELRQVPHKQGVVLVDEDVQINPMLAAGCKRFAIFAATTYHEYHD